MKNFDYLVVGGGIVGMTVARYLALSGKSNIGILEKESQLGCHSSGRNSGVLHSGIYYSSDSLKAKVCVSGSKMMQEYAFEHRIPIKKNGKLIIAPTEEQIPQVEVLYERAIRNGITVERVDSKQIKEIEHEALTDFAPALFSPNTAVIDTKAVLNQIESEVAGKGVQIIKNREVVDVDVTGKFVRTNRERFGFGHLINCAGLHADRIAHRMGVGKKYRILPFKGVYRKLRPDVANRFKGSIYPTPDLRVPFLGVHITRTVGDEVIIGPTAMPAFGRENYGIIKGWSFTESPAIAASLASMFLRDSGGFRTLVLEELGKYYFPNFIRAAQKLAPSLKAEHFIENRKVGLRAQLVDLEKMKLEMDFVIEDGPASTHILNAVSPAFTASFAFAKLVCDKIV